MFTPIVAKPEFDKSENTTGSTEDTKTNIEAEDEVSPSKRKKTCGCTQMRKKKEKRKKNSKRIPKERRHMDIINRKEKRDHLCISGTFLMSRIPSFRWKIL